MSLLAIALKNIRQRLLASSLTGVSVALGVALMVAVLVLNGVFSQMFSQDSVGYNLIVGKKGGAWTLVLNTIFRVDQPTGQVPWRFYQRLKENRYVNQAIPLAVSDTTQVGGFPIVATIPQYFGVPYAYGPDGPKMFGIPKEGDHTFLRGTWDAVIGSEVARVNNWGLGSEFQLVHSGQDDHIHEEKFTVRGVLAPTGTANDRTAFVHVDGFFLLAGHNDSIDDAIQREVEFLGETEEQIREHYKTDLEAIAKEEAAHAGGGHDGHHHSHLPPSDLQKGVTAILVVTRGDNPNSRSLSAIQLSGEMNSKAVGPQAVQPVAVLSQIRDRLVGNINLALLVLTILIIVVSGVGIFVSIYNSMSDRRREIAIMRALGAPRSAVFSVILLESLMLCVGGALLGLALGHGLVMAASPIVEAKSGLLIDPFAFERTELWLIPAMIGMATLVGFLPGLTAYRTDVAAALAE